MSVRALSLAASRAAVAAVWTLRRRPSGTGPRVPVLCYHRVLPGFVDADVPAYSVAPERFDAQMRFLRTAGFHTLALDEYLAAARGEGPLPERAVLVTFDDGYADFLHSALPIARAHGARLTLFVSTGLVDGAGVSVYPTWTTQMRQHAARHPELWRALTWHELGLLRDEGVGIGFHTHAHVAVSGLGRAALAADAARGLALLDAHLGARPRAFAFPHGDAHSYTAHSVAVLRDAGLEYLFTTRMGRTPLPYAGATVDRHVVHYEDDLAVFERKLLGGYDWLARPRDVATSLRKGARRTRPPSDPEL